jgi:predicted transcriptional regulator
MAQDISDGGMIWVPNLILGSGISKPAKFVYLTLCNFADEHGYVEGLSGRALAQHAGMSKNTYWRALNELIDAGLVAKNKPRLGDFNRYRIGPYNLP